MTSTRSSASLRVARVFATVLALCLAAGAARAQGPEPLKRPGVWAQTYADRLPDPAVRFGVLPNGMRYAIRHNATPAGQTALRLWIGSGSLAERDDQRGLAHFLEHMAFRGSTNVPSGDMVRTLQRLGLSFGADTNARTGLDQTVYQLDLPRSDTATTDTGLMLLREIAGELTIAPAELESERGVVLSEARLRDSPAYRQNVAELAFELEGQLLPRRMPIGEPEIIRTAPAALLRDFYETHYRPDNAVLVAVGDFDVAAMEAAVRARFGGWAAKRPAPAAPALGEVLGRGAAVRSLTEAGAAPALSLAWVAPYDPAADTVARGRRDIADLVVSGVLNHRLDRLEQSSDAPFLAASAGRSNFARSASLSRLSVQPKPGAWVPALDAAVAEQRRLLEFGPRRDELEQVVTETRTTMRVAAAGAATQRSGRIADALVRAANDDEVFADPAQELAEVEAILDTLTPAEVSAATKRLFSGSGPLVFASGPEPVAGGEAAIATALTAAQARPVQEVAAGAARSWPYAPAATPGQVAARTEIADLGVTEIRFANGVRLLAKRTDFARSEIQVRVRVGAGRLGIPAELAEASWMVGGLAPILRLGGTQALTYEEIEALTAGNRLGMNLSLDDDAFALSGTTQPDDLDRQLQLLQAYMVQPGLRVAAFDRIKAALASRLPQIDATASGVFSREAGLALHGGDRRWQAVPSPAALAAGKPDDLAALLARDLANGPIEIAIVGDVEVDRAVAAVAASFGALPPRPERPAPGPAAAGLRFPAGNAAPLAFTHRGRPDQTMVMAAWPTGDFFAEPQVQRVLTVTAQILQSRLTDRLRTAEGLTYSPSVQIETSRVFTGYGYLQAAVETRTDRMDEFYAELGRQVAALQEAPPTEDEMDRARRPLVDQRIKLLRTNSYWVSVLSGALSDARQFDAVRALVPGMEKVTAGEVMAAARRFLVPGTQFRLAVRPAKAE